jgi:hypothetical protein
MKAIIAAAVLLNDETSIEIASIKRESEGELV